VLTLIVGTGYTGNRVLQRFPADSAIGLSRSVPEMSSGHASSGFDLDQDASLPINLPDRYCILYTVPPDGNDAADSRLTRLLGLLPVAPARLVYISTTGVYGNRDGAMVTEPAEPQPGPDHSRRRLAAEQLLRQWCRQHRVGLVILRVPGIYGPDRLGIAQIRAGTPVLLEADAYPGNRIHISDLVSCCLSAAASSVPAGIYNVGDSDMRSATWFAHEVARQSGLPPRPEISRAQAEAEFSALRMSFLAESRRIDTRKMREVLGVIPRYTNAEEGIRASIIEIADRG